MMCCHDFNIALKRLKFVYQLQLAVKILKSGKIRKIIIDLADNVQIQGLFDPIFR